MDADRTEIFAIYDANGELVGTAPRHTAHRDGLYHRSVHVLVRNSAAALLIAQRGPHKDVCAGLWDLSCGEHVQPGESYEQAARRGLVEELGITAAVLTRLRPPRLQQHVDTTRAIDDREFVELWQTVYDVPLEAHGAEVAALQFVDLAVLRAEMDASAGDYTPWLRDELRFITRAR